MKGRLGTVAWNRNGRARNRWDIYSPEQHSMGPPLHRGSHHDLLFDTRPCLLTYMTCLAALGLELEVKFVIAGTSLVVQWLRLRTSNVGSAGSFPGRGQQDPTCSAAKKFKKKKKFVIPVVMVLFIYFYWSKIALQCCASFCCTMK